MKLVQKLFLKETSPIFSAKSVEYLLTPPVSTNISKRRSSVRSTLESIKDDSLNWREDKKLHKPLPKRNTPSLAYQSIRKTEFLRNF